MLDFTFARAVFFLVDALAGFVLLAGIVVIALAFLASDFAAGVLGGWVAASSLGGFVVSQIGRALVHLAQIGEDTLAELEEMAGENDEAV